MVGSSPVSSPRVRQLDAFPERLHAQAALQPRGHARAGSDLVAVSRTFIWDGHVAQEYTRYSPPTYHPS